MIVETCQIDILILGRGEAGGRRGERVLTSGRWPDKKHTVYRWYCSVGRMLTGRGCAALVATLKCNSKGLTVNDHTISNRPHTRKTPLCHITINTNHRGQKRVHSDTLALSSQRDTEDIGQMKGGD